MAKQTNFDDLPGDAFLRQPQVLNLVPFSSATLWRKVKDGSFPSPVKLSERCTAWKIQAIREWLAAQASA